jgi:hypothetical protein
MADESFDQLLAIINNPPQHSLNKTHHTIRRRNTKRTKREAKSLEQLYNPCETPIIKMIKQKKRSATRRERGEFKLGQKQYYQGEEYDFYPALRINALCRHTKLTPVYTKNWLKGIDKIKANPQRKSEKDALLDHLYLQENERRCIKYSQYLVNIKDFHALIKQIYQHMENLKSIRPLLLDPLSMTKIEYKTLLMDDSQCQTIISKTSIDFDDRKKVIKHLRHLGLQGHLIGPLGRLLSGYAPTYQQLDKYTNNLHKAKQKAQKSTLLEQIHQHAKSIYNEDGSLHYYSSEYFMWKMLDLMSRSISPIKHAVQFLTKMMEQTAHLLLFPKYCYTAEEIDYFQEASRQIYTIRHNAQYHPEVLQMITINYPDRDFTPQYFATLFKRQEEFLVEQLRYDQQDGDDSLSEDDDNRSIYDDSDDDDAMREWMKRKSFT